MIKVKKGNKVVQVQESVLPYYLKNGFDQIDKEGKIIERATGGKNVSVAEYNKALDAIKQLNVENKSLKSDNKLKDMKSKVKELENIKKELVDENKKISEELEKTKIEAK
ncbi:hypothetical protein [Alkalibaculum sporogenes]|uniref:hypothetical protein n=1 Tax=Alkalibaculum sporogenes TaxID=2655001 RepID=UPI001A9B4138|nr:hypothetical protein [Alkalibaculum sporogenes]